MPVIRRGEPSDLEAIQRIQTVSPEAAQWDPPDYLNYDLFVAVCDGQIAGFLVMRLLGPPESAMECEVLNLAVAPEQRGHGVARNLLEAFLGGYSGVTYLEVRESNGRARNFYKSMGFQEVNRRENYYLSPMEAAIVMKFHSC